MLLLNTEITPLIDSALSIEIRDQQFLKSPFHSQPSFHAHPELELVYVLEGYGKRIVGDSIEPFKPSDMVFIGANVPHIWLSDEAFYQEDSKLQSRVIITYFNPVYFREIFDHVAEFTAIKELIKDASKGIKIFGETRDNIGEKLISMSLTSGFEKMDKFLQILHLISISQYTSFIINCDVGSNSSQCSDRLIDVIRFVKNNLHSQIYLRDVANIACMTEQSFSRFFRSRINKSFSEYLSDLRISNACKLLIQTDKSISEIASLCGYNSPSHFCKIFKEQLDISPYRYKKSIEI